MFKNKKKSMETDPKSGGTPPLMENSILFFFFIEPFPKTHPHDVLELLALVDPVDGDEGGGDHVKEVAPSQAKAEV